MKYIWPFPLFTYKANYFREFCSTGEEGDVCEMGLMDVLVRIQALCEVVFYHSNSISQS